MSKVLGIIVSVALILGVGGYFLATSADAATPADPLFSVDTTFESIQRLLTFDDVAKVNLENALLEERQLEIETMLQDKDVTQEQIEEALQLMTQQRTRAYERIGQVEEKGDEEALKSMEQLKAKYLENLDKQLGTAQKAEAKFTGLNNDITQEMQVNMEEEKNTLNNAGEDTQIQQQNQEQNTDNSNSDNGNGSSGSSGNGKN